jgi:hypothetical protein
MKRVLVFSLFFAALAGHAEAAALDYADVDVVSVVPRSPDVKPIVLVIFPEADKHKIAISARPEAQMAKQSVKRSGR